METKKALLVISFGTSFRETEIETICKIEEDMQKQFPDRTFYRAWTSGMIRKKVQIEQERSISSLQECLEQMQKDGITDVLAQLTYVACGEEYEKAVQTLQTYRTNFSALHVGRPLLATKEDVSAAAEELCRLFPLPEEEMLILMGHGSASANFAVYEELNRCFERTGHANFCVGTVEFSPGIEPALEAVRRRNPKQVYLTPLLVVAGDHATNDMAGKQEDSWRRQLEKEGAEVTCIVKGLGEYPQIRALFSAHAKQAEEKE